MFRKNKKIRRHYWQYLPEYFIKGIILFLLTAWLISEWMYWKQFYYINQGFKATSSTYGYRATNMMLKQASLKEQEADFLGQLDSVITSAQLQSGRLLSQKMYGYGAILDADTGEVILDTERNAVFLLIRGYEEDFLNPAYPVQVSRFVCYEDDIQEPWRQLNLWQKELRKDPDYMKYGSRGKYSVNIEDFYIKGDRFLPGKVNVEISYELNGENGQHTFERRKEYDFTPEDTTGYEYWQASDFEWSYLSRYRYYYDELNAVESLWDQEEDMIVMGGPDVKAEAMELMRERGRRYMYGTDNTGIPTKKPALAFLNWKMSFFNTIPLRNPDGSGYVLLMYWKYGDLNLLKETEIQIFLKLLAVLFVILMMGFAAIDYLINRYKFMTGEYRKVLIDSMAHDLKSPLMAISGYAENLKENVHEEKREYYADGIISSVTYMEQLVQKNRELLNFQRFQKPLQKTKLDMRKLCENVFERYELEVTRKQLEIVLEGEMTVKADAYLMERVVDNLISNAVKYSQEKSRVELYFGKNEFRIQNQAELTYSGRLSKLWEPMVRGEKSRSGRGTGLGLSIAAHILDRHKWKYKLIYHKDTKTFICRLRIPCGLLF